MKRTMETLYEITLLHSHGLIDDVSLAMVAVHFNIKHHVRWMLQESARQKVSNLYIWTLLLILFHMMPITLVLAPAVAVTAGWRSSHLGGSA